MTSPTPSKSTTLLGTNSRDITTVALRPVQDGGRGSVFMRHNINVADDDLNEGAVLQMYEDLGRAVLNSTHQKLAKTFDQLVKDIGLQHAVSRPYSPTEKCAVERLNHVLKQENIAFHSIASVKKAIASLSKPIETEVTNAPSATGKSRVKTGSHASKTKHRVSVNKSTQATFKTTNT